MSPLPHTPPRRRRLALTLLVLAGTAVACSDDAPTAASTELGTAPRASVTYTSRRERDSLERLLERERARIDAVEDRSDAAFDADMDAWKAEEELAEDGRNLSLLRCKPLPYDGEAKIIGPSGGEIQMGPHRLRIPKGALRRNVVITGEASSGSIVAVSFSPHGLVFAVHPELSLSYAHCSHSTASAGHSVVYSDPAKSLLEFPPSTDADRVDQVIAKIAHFSSYMVAYRSGTTTSAAEEIE
jgi:hypothetical protein